MLILELTLSAWESLRTHKLRTFLTALGVIFGVAAVIGMASIGEGARREALRQIELMGASNILIDHHRPGEGEARTNSLDRNPRGLTLKDAEALCAVLGGAVRVVPLSVNEVKASAEGRTVSSNLVATMPEYFNIYDRPLSSGRKLAVGDEENYQPVCLLGWEAARELFPLKSPLGKEVRIRDQLLTVVGVVRGRAVGKGEIEGVPLRNENLDIYIPLQTALKRQPASTDDNSQLTRIVASVEEPSLLADYAGLIERIMRRRHRGVADYKVLVPEELLRQHQATQRIFNVVMGAIASISLLVGGIGIMNIMLASVLERTREIGIRRAVGARQSDIARQFLVEAVLLSLSGGIVGVILGVLLAHGITLFAGWETAVSWWAILVAVVVSMGVGVIFGWLPARRAARLDPIMSLRFE